MLEEPALLLRPWVGARSGPPGRRSVQPEPGPERAIVEPTSGKVLGVVRRRPGTRSWLDWLAAPVLEVYESLDESLLCTLRPRWGLPPGREVRDAEGRRVGVVCCGVVYDRLGWRFARRRRFDHSPAARFLASDGSELATLTASDEGALLTFAPCMEANPFAKMVLLAAVLTDASAG
jgi:hypothetical protein